MKIVLKSAMALHLLHFFSAQHKHNEIISKSINKFLIMC